MNERYKIGEAKFFLERMEESIGDHITFRYYLSAFMSAARSVLQYAQKEFVKKSRLKSYETTIADNDILSYFKVPRDSNIHRVPVEPTTYISMAPFSEPTVVYRFSYWTGHEDVISLSHRYVEALEKFVQKGMEEGILSG